MAVELEHSPIMEDLKRVMASPASPYWRFQVTIHCGGKDIQPMQVIRHDIDRDYRASSMDSSSIVLSLGAGTMMNEIVPFKDDLRITINKTALTDGGSDTTNSAISSTTYRAYIGDDTATQAESSNNPSHTDTETANRFSIKHVCFILEGVAEEQLRKQQLGVIARSTPPYKVMQTLIVNACQALKLGKDEVIAGFDMVEPNSLTPRDHVIIPDGTPVLEIPDLIQNKQGGIYSTGLGFYIQNRIVYAWPMYDTQRQATAKRVLTILLAPNKFSTLVDKTWINNDRMLTIYSSGINKVIDESLDKLNTEGNGVRFASPDSLLNGFVSVKDNKMTASRTKNNSEYSTTVVGNGQNLTPVSGTKVTANVYLETSKLAKRGGATMFVPWRRSNPDLVVPGMAVEILYDFNGVIRTIEGTLTHAVHSYELEGRGMVADLIQCNSALSIFIDRTDPDYLAFIKAGGSISPTPTMGQI